MTWEPLEAESNLTELIRLILRLRDLIEPGPHTQIPRYLTDQQRKAENELIRRERGERILNQRRGLSGLGASPAPVVIGPTSALAAVHAGLTRLEALVFDRLALIPWPVEYPTDVRRCQRIAERLPLLQDPFASWLLRQTDRLVIVAQVAADEDRQYPMGRPCPICGRDDKLVAYVDRGYVRCNADGCVCSVPDCKCRDRAGWRHVWDRPQWGLLARGIAAAQARAEQVAA